MSVKSTGFMTSTWKEIYATWKMKGDFISRTFEMSLEWLKKKATK